MRVLIVGASGFVGNALQAVFGAEAVGTYCTHPVPGLHAIDARDAGAVSRIVCDVGPELIIQTAAQAHVDWCEEHAEESFDINVRGTRNVAEAARVVGARYVFFSTDYVFSGATGPYGEDATPAPVNVYGRHKLEAERLIAQSLDNHVIVRACGVFGFQRQGNNFVMGLLERGRHAEPMSVPWDQWGTPTYADNLADAVRELALSTHRGVYHVVGPECLDRATFARLACEVFGIDPGFLRPCSTRELRQRAPRPLRGGLTTAKVRAVLTTPLVAPRRGLELMKLRLQHEGWLA
jgi:dTDP-4-dehydrorhamnose reductase